MKNWIYVIVWKKGRVHFCDGKAFKTLAEAQTYAGIELTQMEYDGYIYNINPIELV